MLPIHLRKDTIRFKNYFSKPLQKGKKRKWLLLVWYIAGSRGAMGTAGFFSNKIKEWTYQRYSDLALESKSSFPTIALLV